MAGPGGGSRFTVGVFQDEAWATRGLDALKQRGFPREAMSMLAVDGAEVSAFLQRTIGADLSRMTLPRLGAVVAAGTLVGALDGPSGAWTRAGLAASMTRIGFQLHDGQIFEALLAKGGILVAVEGEPRAADALAVLLSHGGANAAIGAWTGRL